MDGVATVVQGATSIETTDAEVTRVVELVLEHARTRPEESLGVIALGIRHAERLDEAVTAALRTAPDVSAFFADDREERFFVKNLERVQGDERDAIILSVGYGKTPHGRVLYRFGPLNIEGGERRLNVAITRARRRMTVVSVLAATDLDASRLKARGAQMLRDFLAYAQAQSEGRASEPEKEADRPAKGDPLRQDLARRLRREGLTVHEDYGNATQRIDLAVEDPYHPGRALLAIETDGPRYAALRSTRERDRLRPEQLERLGWTHVRVWSTDLFRDPARQIARIVALARDTGDRGPDAPERLHEAATAASRSASSADEADRADDGQGEAPAAKGRGKGRLKRRRVFRKGTGAAAETEDTEGAAERRQRRRGRREADPRRHRPRLGRAAGRPGRA